MLVSPIHRHTATLNVYPLSIAIYEDPLMMGLVPALVKWLLPFIIWLSYDSQKSKEDLLMTVASGGEVGTSCEWSPGPRQQLNSGAIQRKPGAAPSTLLLCLSLSFSRCLFLQHEDFAGFFRYWNSGAPSLPPPLLAYKFLVWTTVTIFANCPQCFSSCPFSTSLLLS